MAVAAKQEAARRAVVAMMEVVCQEEWLAAVVAAEVLVEARLVDGLAAVVTQGEGVGMATERSGSAVATVVATV